MKVTVIFVRVINKPEYRNGEQRLLDSYLKFKPKYPHDMVIIDRCGDSPDDVQDALHMRYDGGGWDCGAWQFAGKFAGKNIDTDLLVCFNSSTYITGNGWLERFILAVELHGNGLYGPLTSYEVIPHVRTPCMIFQPKIINDYPETVKTRDDTWRFESLGWPNGTPNFTQWVRNNGLHTMLVTWDGVYDYPEWRKPPNIFRRGDQSNLIVKDRHCEAYEVSNSTGKSTLERLADGR